MILLIKIQDNFKWLIWRLIAIVTQAKDPILTHLRKIYLALIDRFGQAGQLNIRDRVC